MEDALKARLKTRVVGRKLVYRPSVTSTMDVARDLARQGATDGTVIIAGEQTAGRGRMGRAWLSPHGSLAMSVILKPAASPMPQLVMMASLAVVRAIKQSLKLPARIKWPNDVLIHGRKVCGILTEAEMEGSAVRFAIVGIGLNVNFDTQASPEIGALATSLSEELGQPVSYPDVTAAVIAAMDRLYRQVKTGKTLREEWQASMDTIGKAIRVQAGRTVEEGMAVGVTPDGGLLLRRRDGTTATIVVGDVTVLKE